MLVDVDAYGRCGNLQCAVNVNSAKMTGGTTCKFGEYLGWWRGYRVAHHPTLVIAKHSQNVVAVEVDGHLSAVGVVDFDCVRIDLGYILDRKSLVSLCG